MNTMDAKRPPTSNISCPVCCTAAGSYAVPAGEGYRVHKCPNCGLEYTDPVPTEQELTAFYQDYTDPRAEPEIVLRNAQENLRALEAFGLTPDSTILDFGCGNGKFVELAGERCFGVELANKSASSRIASSLAELSNKRFDFITLWGVLEHLPNPVKTMRDLAQRLQSGGAIVLTTVLADGLIPYYFKPPEHLTYWTRIALTELLHGLDMELVEFRPYTMYQLSSIYLQRLLSRSPKEIAALALGSAMDLPRIVHVPTNELFAVARPRPLSQEKQHV